MFEISEEVDSSVCVSCDVEFGRTTFAIRETRDMARPQCWVEFSSDIALMHAVLLAQNSTPDQNAREESGAPNNPDAELS
jgi:hypothetical protein